MRGEVTLLLIVACYSPSPQPGAPCADGRCPRPLVCSPATNTCERDAVDAASIDAPIPIDAPVPDVMPSAFAYRRQLTITNTSNTALPAGFTIRVAPGAMALPDLVAMGKLRSDFADLRVIGTVAGERDRIIDVGGVAPTALWFSLASPLAAGAATTDYSIYYGAPSATLAPTSGPAVFKIYDDFTNGIAGVWLKNDGPTVSNGQLVLRQAHQDAITTNALTDQLPIVSAVELVASVTNVQSDPTPTADGTFYYWFGYQHTGDFTASDPWVIWIARGKGAVGVEQKSPVGCEAGCGNTPVTQNTAAHHYAIERDSTETRFYRDGALAYTHAVSNNGDYSVMVRNYLMTGEVRVDWIRARLRANPDPTVTVGLETPN